MCGRISQYRDPLLYTQHLGIADPLRLFDAADRRPGYNLAPGTHPLAIYPDNTLHAIHWGYRPKWAREQHLPQTINARAEAAPTSRYFEDLWKVGRILVPADGWFEWRVEAGQRPEHGARAESRGGNGENDERRRSGNALGGGPIRRNRKATVAAHHDEPADTDASAATIRQPYYVYLKSDAPMYLAALSNVRGTEAQTEGMGLVIVTARADAGLIDVHGRRPLVFAPDAARRWLDPALPLDELEQLTRGACVPAGRFRWHRVTAEVDRTLNDEPGLIEALQ